MTTSALVDQQYRKLFADFIFPSSPLDPVEKVLFIWGLKRQLLGFSATHGLPTVAFLERISTTGDDLHRLLAIELLFRPEAVVDERLLRLFYQPENASILRQLVRLIAQHEVTGCVDILQALESHPDSHVRTQAIVVRRQFLGPQPWQADLHHTRDESYSVQYDAYERLAAHGQDVPLFVWQQAYEHSGDDVRKIAIQQLATYSGEFIDALMLEAICDKDFVIAKSAREYLKRDPDRFFDHLARLLPVSRAQTTNFALDVLCRSKNPAVFKLLERTYDTAKSEDVRKKVLVEMQKIKSVESTRFFLTRGELKPVQSRNLRGFLPELIQLAVARNYDALPLIVKHGKAETKAALLAVFEDSNVSVFVQNRALEAYFEGGGELTDTIHAFLVQAMAGDVAHAFDDAAHLVKAHRLTPLIGNLRQLAGTCTDQNQLGKIKQILEDLGEDQASIQVAEKPLHEVLQSRDDAAIVTVLSRTAPQDLVAHDKQLQSLMYFDNADVRALARAALLTLDDAGTRSCIGQDVARYGVERVGKAIEHASAVGVDGFLYPLHRRAYDNDPQLAALALAALETSRDGSIDLARIRRNADLNRQIKSDPHACAGMPNEALLALAQDEFCSVGREAAKVLLLQATLSPRDPEFAYLSIVAQNHDQLFTCAPADVESALRKLARYPHGLQYWSAFESLLQRGADIQPLCREILMQGCRSQQEAAASALNKVELLDYDALLEGPGRRLNALALVMKVLENHFALVKAADLKRLYDWHFASFSLLSEARDDIVYRYASSGIIAVLSARQKIGCSQFLQDAIQYVEQQRARQVPFGSEVIHSIGRIESKEALFYLVSLLRTKEVAIASAALRNRIDEIERPCNKLIVALYSRQSQKFAPLKDSLKAISAEDFAILQKAAREASLKETFLEMCKAFGPVFYRHALDPSVSIVPGSEETFCNFFSQKAYKESDAFLLHYLQHSYGNAQMRIYCIRGLGKTRCRQALPLVEASLQKGDPVEQRAAIEALARIGNAETIEKLKAMQPSLRKNLVDVCGKAIDLIHKELQAG